MEQEAGGVGLINVNIAVMKKIKQFFQVYKLWSEPDIDFLLFRGGGRVVSDVQDGLGFGWDYMRGWFQMPQQEREDAWGLPLPPAAQAAPASGEHHQRGRSGVVEGVMEGGMEGVMEDGTRCDGVRDI